MVARKSLLVGLLAYAASGQTSEKVFTFAHLDTPQALQEVVNAVRVVGGIGDITPDAAKRSLTVRGSADEIAVAGWLAAELDKAGGATGTRDLPINDAKAPLAQVIYLSQVDNQRDLQDMVNAIRAVLDIQRCYPMNRQKAIVMRGLPSQVKAADWILGTLDRPAGAQPDYRLPEEDWNARLGDLVIRVTALSRSDTPVVLQEMTNLTRSMTEMYRIYPLSSRGSLVMRGTKDQIELAGWLLNQFDGPAAEGTKEFKVGSAGGQMVQVAFASRGTTSQSLQEIVIRIHSETMMQRVLPFKPRQAVVMRGTADQLARAQQVIQQMQGR